MLRNTLEVEHVIGCSYVLHVCSFRHNKLSSQFPSPSCREVGLVKNHMIFDHTDFPEQSILYFLQTV